jgi:secreted trypsin-like serine protease
MQASLASLPWIRQVFAAIAMVLAAMPAAAIVGGNVDPNGPQSPWKGVGSVLVGNGSFSGVLIAPGYVLTAQHLVAAMDVSQLSFQLNLGATDPTVLKVAEVFLAAGFPGFGGGSSQIPANDLAILRLAELAPAGAATYAIGAAPRVGEELRLVGYGTDASGQADPSRKREGSNLVDRYLPSIDAAGKVTTAGAYWFDYDTDRTALPMEATLGGGDSGGPAFVQRNGVWQLVGINTFAAQSSAGLPLGGGGLALESHRAWIDSIIQPVPEPGIHAMFLAGLVVMGVGALQRRRMRRHKEMQ